MTDERGEQDELAAELSALVRAEKARPAVESTELRRLRGRIDEALDADIARPVRPTSTPRTTSSARLAWFAAGAIAGAIATWLAKRPVPGSAITLSTLAAHDAPQPTAAMTEPITRRADARPQEQGSARSATLDPSASARAASPQPDRRARDVHAIEDRELERERSLIEAARSAVARGSHEAALAAVREHEAEFRRGRLSEERDVLRVLALARSGRAGEAWARAQVFLQRYPESLSRAQVEAAARPRP